MGEQKDGTIAAEASPGKDAGPEGIPLPAFVVQRRDGLFVDLPTLDSEAGFGRFVERLFASSARFEGVQCEVLSRLLNIGDQSAIGALTARLGKLGKKPELMLAMGIAAFPEERKALYRGFRIDPSQQSAEYMFEPVTIERSVDEPVYAEPAEGEEAPAEPVVVRWERRTFTEKTQLDLDEFIAAAWENGVRFGIDAGAVRDAIARGHTGRVVIARGLPAKPGEDATLIEQTRALHRDNAPKILGDGRVDLRQFQNRFPQIKAGTRLLKKIPRTPGENGRDVGNTVLEPPPTKDFDFESLAGPGTAVEHNADGEFIVALQDGFLSIDAGSNQVSIAEKIVSHEGISARTTGDLILCGDYYEEHGEVQEMRLVDGFNMAFFGDVFGNLVSHGGEITLHAGLAGGSAESHQGSVVVEGKASRARILARGGEIRAAYAESCMIVAARVKIERAIQCTICADEVEIGSAEGCAIAARDARIGASGTRRELENSLSMRLPDLGGFDDNLRAKSRQLARIAESTASVEREMAELTEGKELKTFLALAQRIQSGNLVLSAEQKPSWEAMRNRNQTALRQFGILRARIKALQDEQAALGREIESCRVERASAARGVRCAIAQINGETLVRTIRVASDETPLELLSGRELEIRLRAPERSETRLFSGAAGDFDWRFEAPETTADPE